MAAVEALRFIEETTTNVDLVQERVLAEILARNAGAEYLSNCGLDGAAAADRATFRAKVPVVSYEDLQPYIQRIADGDGSAVLSTRPITRFITSSGTSGGQRKLMPTVDDEGGRQQLLGSLVTSVINLHFPGVDKGKGLYFLFVREETKTPSGLVAAPILTSYYKTQHFTDAHSRNRHTGAMAQYVPTLRYYSGGLPMVCTAYVSSECCFGLNLRPLCDPSEVSYTIMPTMGYFEFLPVDQLDHENETGTDKKQLLVDLARVEVGREYEPVITTYAGLNRYRVGDVLRVTGFHNTAPQFQIVRRQNVILSIEYEKTDETELQRAVERASALLRPHGACVAEYTSHACTRRIPGHYVIYWELLVTGSGTVGKVGKETLERCCLEMEEALSTVYRQSRVADGSIGPLEIRVVRPGTFEELMDNAISRGASINQYKTPRCIMLPEIVELFDSCGVSSHFSPAMPHWTTAARRSD